MDHRDIYLMLIHVLYRPIVPHGERGRLHISPKPVLIGDVEYESLIGNP